MLFGRNRFKKLTFLTAAGYLFLFAIAAKGVALYEGRHPLKEDLLPVSGYVREAHIGGDGRATYFQIESDGETSQYSSYFGKVWPGMELIREGDHLYVLAERNRMSRGELITGRQYYIWELIHNKRVIVAYEDIHELVQSEEAVLNRYVNVVLMMSTLLLIIAYVRKISGPAKDEGK